MKDKIVRALRASTTKKIATGVAIAITPGLAAGVVIYLAGRKLLKKIRSK